MKFLIKTALVLLTLTIQCQCTIHRRKLSPVIWTAQNDLFKQKIDYGINNLLPHQAVIDVQIGEFLNLICPVYNFNDNEFRNVEYHTLYLVSKTEYDSCKINSIHTARQILRCDKPFENVKYTFYISRFSPVPGAIEFIPGNDYYVISTSNGTLNGLNNTYGGGCHDSNMKLVIRVLESIKRTKSNISYKPLAHIYNKPKKQLSTSTTTTTTTTTVKPTTRRPFSVQSKALKSILPHTEMKITYVEVPYVEKETTTPTNDIFLLEPDDYSDIISQFITANNSDYYYNIKNTKSYLISSGSLVLPDHRLLFMLPCFFVFINLIHRLNSSIV